MKPFVLLGVLFLVLVLDPLMVEQLFCSKKADVGFEKNIPVQRDRHHRNRAVVSGAKCRVIEQDRSGGDLLPVDLEAEPHTLIKVADQLDLRQVMEKAVEWRRVAVCHLHTIQEDIRERDQYYTWLRR